MMKRESTLAKAIRLVDRKDQIVYDACANIGQIVSNLPRSALILIVADFLRENDAASR